ncbi:MAG: ammonium transporter, partial [Dehalococcoidia bacterium]|nr:ammonium transporter [Dehalococcoidia bacterium]
KFSAYLVYTVLITGFVYPIVTHWIWDGNGWLTAFSDDPMNGVGMVDFAGSTVVHSVGGWAALAGAIVIGPRIGKFDKEGRARAIPGHSIPLAALGVFILWFGWYGFNPGSTTTANTDIAGIAVTTTLAAAAGAVFAMVTAWMKFGKPDVGMSLNGALAGLVAITAGCANVSPASAVLIGAIAGVLVVGSVLFFDMVKVDDPVGAVSVHGVCG